MRETQFIGLSPEAETWLVKNCIFEHDKCPHCNEILENTKRLEVVGKSGVVEGMFAEEVCNLRVFKTNDGNKISEVEQCTPWSSGPVIFLCLQDLKTAKNFCEWSEEDIQGYL